MAMFAVPHNSDWHCHTTCSDGGLAPTALLELAQQSGVEHVAITDHDNFMAYRQLAKTGTSHVTLTCAMEMSVVWRGRTLHVLSYGFAPDDPGHLAFEAMQTQNRRARAQVIAEKLSRKLSVKDLYEKACNLSASDYPGRPHFAEVLVNEGVVHSATEAFDRWLGQGKLGDIKSHWPTLEEAMQMSATGVRVLAHPVKYRMTATKLRECLSAFRALGGAGVEVSVPGMSSGWYGQLVSMARQFDLLVSGGSDFHQHGRWSVLGRYPKMPAGLPTLADHLAVAV